MCVYRERQWEDFRTSGMFPKLKVSSKVVRKYQLACLVWNTSYKKWIREWMDKDRRQHHLDFPVEIKLAMELRQVHLSQSLRAEISRIT